MFFYASSTGNSHLYQKDEFHGNVIKVLQVAVTTAILPILLLVFLFYVGVAFLWIWILDSLPADMVNLTGVTPAMESIGSIFVFLYLSIWLNDSVGGYSDGPKTLRSLLFQIAYVTHQGCRFIDYYYHDTNDPKIHEALEKNLETLKIKSLATLVGMYRLFMPNSSPHRSIPKGIRDEIVKQLQHAEQLAHSSKPIDIAISLLVDYRAWSHGSKEDRVYYENQLMIPDALFTKLNETVEAADRETNIRGSTIFRTHMMMVLYLYFFIWLPISIKPFVEDLIFVVVYPLLMFILTAPMIYRKWLKDPFSPHRPIIYNNYTEWFDDFAVSIIESCELFSYTHRTEVSSTTNSNTTIQASEEDKQNGVISRRSTNSSVTLDIPQQNT